MSCKRTGPVPEYIDGCVREFIEKLLNALLCNHGKRDINFINVACLRQSQQIARVAFSFDTHQPAISLVVAVFKIADDDTAL